MSRDLLEREGQRERARLLGLSELLLGPLADPREIRDRLGAVSEDDVRRVIGEYLLSRRWTVSVVGPEPP